MPETRGPLSVLEDDNKFGNYNFTRTTFPLEGIGLLGDKTGSKGVPNYIIFYINVPIQSKYNTSENTVTGVRSTSEQNIDATRGSNQLYQSSGGDAALEATVITTGKQLAVGAVKALSSGRNVVQSLGEIGVTSATRGVVTGIIAAASTQIERRPKLQRMKEAIAIYMPDTVVHTDSHDYDSVSVTRELKDLRLAQLGGGLAAEAKKQFPAFLGGGGEEFSIEKLLSAGGTEFLGRIAQDTDIVGSRFTDLALRSQGLAINPQVEMLYDKTDFRRFRYIFKMNPKSEPERDAIFNIIKSFRKYAAPELTDNRGLYFTPPAQFDIEYMFVAEQNKFIGKISTCVLESIDVDYSSAGQFATFYDGSPVEVQIQLQFREVDIITREMVERGF